MISEPPMLISELNYVKKKFTCYNIIDRILRKKNHLDILYDNFLFLFLFVYINAILGG